MVWGTVDARGGAAGRDGLLLVDVPHKGLAAATGSVRNGVDSDSGAIAPPPPPPRQSHFDTFV